MDDEIIAEIHAVRQAHAARFDFDIDRILADLVASEAARSQAEWPLVMAEPDAQPLPRRGRRPRGAPV